MFRRANFYAFLLLSIVILLALQANSALGQEGHPPADPAGRPIGGATPNGERLIISLQSPPLLERLRKAEQERPLTDAERASLRATVLAEIAAEQQAVLQILWENQLITASGRQFIDLVNGLTVVARPGARAAIAALPGVAALHDDQTAEILLAQSVPQIGAPVVWAMVDDDGNPVRGNGVRVGILDTGVDYTHPDLGGCLGPGCRVALGYDFVNGDDDPMDDNGHGTHVAGIIGANGGVTGVAPEATLAAYKVCSAGGVCWHSDIIAALERSLVDEVDIVNISIGGPPGPPNSPLVVATNNTVDEGLLVVVAAGNEGWRGYRTITTPGVAEKALTVGAAARFSTEPATFSSKGPVDGYRIKPNLLAPGEQIVSTYLGHGYQAMSGTSMAAPHTAGAAALLLQLHPDWTPAAIKGSLMANAYTSYQPFAAGNGFLRVDWAANSSLLMQPASLSMGRVDGDEPTWITTSSLTLTNLTSTRKGVRLFVMPYATLPPSAVTFDFSDSTPILGPGQTTTVTFTATVKPSLLPYPPAPEYMHYGKLYAYIGQLYGGGMPFALASPAQECETQTEIPLAECQALATLYDETAGENWWWQGGWRDVPPCGWRGVTCAAGHVSALDVMDNNLYGPFPSAVASLSELESLLVGFNALYGELPPELGSLSQLQHLEAVANNLSGPLPAELGNLAQLQTLGLWQNQFSGPLPAWLGNLTNLEGLALSNNPFTGSIPPELGNLTSLLDLGLWDTNLSGPIPPELGNLSNLHWLFLNDNDHTGMIPATLGNLAQLQSLVLSGNQLTGPIPAELGNLSNLKTLWLQGNLLDGPIPAELGNLSLLDALELSHNQLSGNIPSELGQLANLHWLYLQENRLTGAIPAELGALVNLNGLGIQSNALSGEIPASLANLTALYVTDFGYNALSATDPALLTFLNEKDFDWYQTQTVPPSDFGVKMVWSKSVGLRWTPIPYTGDGGYYQIGLATSPGGPYDFSRTTNSKSTSRFVVSGLEPATTYYFVVQTFTPAHYPQQNALTSTPSPEVTATTLPAD